MDLNMTLEDILGKSPYLKGYEKDPIQMAFYSANCCWWTSFPEDLGKLPPIKYVPGKDGKPGKMVKNPGGHQLPCCPHCHSVLLQAPLKNFVAYAKEIPTNYGERGIQTFTLSHERNSKTCFRRWKDYDIFVKPFPESET
jgi:hypothetical protein